MVFEELVRRLAPKLKRITYKLNGHFSFFNEEDLYQEALMHLWQEFLAGELTDKTDSYILQGCYFYLKNYLRKNFFRRNLISLEQNSEDGESYYLEEILSSVQTESSFEVIHRNMFIEQIKNNGLTKREKEIFCLTLDGLTTREIGKRLGISHVRVVKLQKRIQGKCKKYIDFI